MLNDDVIVLTDADNTLWDTDRVFSEAQLSMLQAVEDIMSRKCVLTDRLGFVRQYDQALADAHHLHLRYPPVMLAFALAAGIRGLQADRAANMVISGRSAETGFPLPLALDAVRIYEDELRQVPELLSGVRKGVSVAADYGIQLHILTEGRIEKQRNIVSHHHMREYFGEIFEITKTTEQFKRLKQRFHPAKLIIFGDQFDRDVKPAIAAECRAVLIPGKFNPRWNSDADLNLASYVARDFLDAIKWVVASEHELRGQSNR